MKFICSCCFCGHGVKKTRLEPWTMTLVSSDDESSQNFWFHAKCLKRAINKAFRDDLIEELGGPKLDFSRMRVLKDHELPEPIRLLRERGMRGRRALFEKAIQKVANETRDKKLPKRFKHRKRG